jgi:hypothetical protein
MFRNVSCLIALLLIAGAAMSQPAKGIGPTTALPFVPAVPPPIFLSPVVSPALKLLTQASVQTEIGLNGRQQRIVEMLNAAWAISPRVWEPGTLWLITPEMGRAAIMLKTKEFFENELTKEQRTRLDQIVFQLREREFGAYAAFAMAARDIGLRDEQMEDVTNLKGLRVEEISKHVTSGDRYAKIKDRVSATNGETYEKMTEMLTKSQRERLKGMQGKVFWGKVDLTGPEVEIRPSLYPSELFGAYDFELRYSASARVRAELETSAEQQEKLSVAADEWDKEYQRLGLSVERAGELHDRTAKALDEVLTPKQRLRFHQLMARRRLLIGGPEAACCYPAVIEAIKITPIQLRALKERKPAADVLTKGDLAALDAFLGQPLKDPDDVNDPILARYTRAKQADEAGRKKSEPFTPLARSFLAISNILKLSDKQITRLRELAEDEPKIMELIQKELDFSDTPPVLGAARSLTSANAVTGRFKAAIEEQCWTVLDAQQQSTARRIFGVKR